jgi:ATP-dependent helicase HrpA
MVPDVNKGSAIEELKRCLPRCLLPDQVRLGSRLAHALDALRQGRTQSIPIERWIGEAQTSVELRRYRERLVETVSYPAELPITARRDEIVAALRHHRVVVVAGETGSGKTTQLPKMCLEAGLGTRAQIGCTQPRRVAALATARRLAEELQVTYGREVGSKIRFNDRVRPETGIKVMTDGILLAEVHGDPLLTDYEMVMVDEAHERSLNIDMLLGHLRNLLTRRDDLRVLVTSATIDTAQFAKAFGGAPVIEVSGRMFPVEVRYRPPAVPDEDEEHEGETYLDAAVAATEEVLQESSAGDVLVFMPSERDIRETSDRLARVLGDAIELVPLFGRLSGAEQDAVFHPGPRRRVVVATNIAETSLTVPRIRYVIDTGLARISRYHPGTRCRRLPVEPIARSNADQRKGRCGRVAEGVCVRVYAEADYLARPAYGDPEIQRCNLADVVLRLKAAGLGEVETFPFLDPPPAAAIRGAYALLQELGALDDERQLTNLGRDLARLPVDPAIGRMLWEARHEHALPEVLVVAAGLSIQDPRERPLDRRDLAESAHRRFTDRESDFVTLLNIWNAYHDTWESLKTQSQLRRFCREHFLSFLRMREWVDLHAQLEEAMTDLGAASGGRAPANYASVHRSLLAGLVGHVAQRKERNLYRLPGERQVHLFPGSGLFIKSEPKSKDPTNPDTPRIRSEQPEWLVTGEIVETTRTYARTAARIEPEWVLQVAPHLVRKVHLHPRWDAPGQRVVATERDLLRGLVLRQQTVGWVRVDPVAATELFIREALLAGGLTKAHSFLLHNRELIHKIELWQTRLRQRVVPDLAETLFQFYARRLQAVGSAPDLERTLKTSSKDYLCATAADLLGDHAQAFERGGLPDAVVLGAETVPIRYAYAPGEAHDGVTYRLGTHLAEVVDPRRLDWAVPALREERVLHLLRSLPKSLRRPLMPLEATAQRLLAEIDPTRPDFVAALSRAVRVHFNVDIPPELWPVAALPPHLQPRFEVIGRGGETLAAGRDLPALIEGLRHQGRDRVDPVWAAAARTWEHHELRDWSIGDLPAEIVVGEVGGWPLKAFPGLHHHEGNVSLRLFRRTEDAQAATAEGVPRLAERLLASEIRGLQHDLRQLRRLAPLYVSLGTVEELLDTAWDHLRARLFPRVAWTELKEAAFRDYLGRASQTVPGAAVALADRLDRVLQRRQEACLHPRPLPVMRPEIDALVPRRLLAVTPWDRLAELPRYLQALIVRAERAAVNPAKDREKQALVQPYLEGLRRLGEAVKGDRPRWEHYQRFRWLLEEFKVSVFAQELGTAERVSAKKLDELLAAG